METFEYRECHKIIPSLNNIHPFKLLHNVNTPNVNIIKVTCYNTCSSIL